MRGSPAATLFLPVLLFFPALAIMAGCQDYDQRARALGREAHREADRACPASAEGDDAAFGTFSADACRVRACEAPCARAGAASFQRVCADVCAARGGCDRDEDCDPGMRCEAVAPVLRRCVKSAADAGR